MQYQNKVIIIGGGPGAAFAYEGAIDAGIKARDIVILATNVGWPVGAFWLRQPLIDLPAQQMQISLLGSADRYSEKMWGKVVNTSAHDLETYTHHGKVESAYDANLHLTFWWGSHSWEKISRPIVRHEIEQLARNNAVICTFDPLQRNKDAMIKYPVWSSPYSSSQNVCMYNGADGAWVRTTFFGGRISVEYPSGSDIEDQEQKKWNTKGEVKLVPDLHPDVQKLSWPDRIADGYLIAGRWAHYDRKYLSHRTRKDTAIWLRSRLNS